MWPLYRKELLGFFSTLTGYIAGGVFFVLVGLLMWVLPTRWNVLLNGEASLSTLFTLAPWVFLFLVPAVTMRMLSDERRDGTLDLLLTRPVSEWTIVLSKFLAAWSLVLILLLPTLVYYVSVMLLADSGAPLDQGATWGSYLGLVFLGGVYAAFGIWVSALTSNALVSFLLTMFFSLLFYVGFDTLAHLDIFSLVEYGVAWLGVAEHYRAISRGVVDSRDVVYFFSLIALVLTLASVSLKRRRG